MKLQLKAVANEYFMNNNCIYVILSRQFTNWSPVQYYVCIYNSDLTSNDTGPDVKASEQQDTMKNLGHRKKSNERQNVICRERLSPIIESGANGRV